MENKILRKLTEEEKQKIKFVVNDVLSEDLPEEPTEYDVLMKQKQKEFILNLLKDDEPEQIDALLEMCEEYIKKDGTAFPGFGSTLALMAMYDMWLNNSLLWPVGHNPEWEEWEKLKEKKVKKT